MSTDPSPTGPLPDQVAAPAVLVPQAPGQPLGLGLAPSPPLFTVRVTREDGSEFTGQKRFDPTQQDARDLVFDLQLQDGGQQPSKDEMDLYAVIGRLQEVLVHLYPSSSESGEKRFRHHFVHLFYLAKLALEGDSLDAGRTRGGRLGPDLARNELKRIEDELIDDEEGRIKNQHLGELGRWGGLFPMPFALG